MDIATAASILAACLALLGGAALRSRRLAFRRAEIEMERLRDVLWEAHEREERDKISAERSLAEAASAARAKSRFLATVTHELRTPLSGMIGAADLLLDTALAPDQRTYAEAVKTSGAAMLSLVDALLDVSRIDAGRIVLRNAAFDIADLVEGVAELLAPRAHAKGLDLAVRIAADTPGWIVGDAPRLRQILLNLAGNAVKFTATGGVGLRVDATGGTVRFTVLDTGPGMDPAEAQRLFGEFERASDDPAESGAGLGLAISAQIAAAMGAPLAVDTRPGEGAAFTLTLPTGTEAGAPAFAASKALAGRKIIVASPTPFGGPWLVERLIENGADARLAGSADAEAFTGVLRACGAETALIDRAAVDQPTALAAAARLGGATTVLALLTPSERRELPSLGEDGFDGYLIKPVRVRSLESRLSDPRLAPGLASNASVPAILLPRSSGLHVLLAEDDPVSALIALAHLRRLGHVVAQTDDGLAACRSFEAHPFDAVVLDLRMPGLDGLSVAQRMRDFESTTGRPAALLVALTADVSSCDRDAALAAGINELLPKPLDASRLAELLAARQPVLVEVA